MYLYVAFVNISVYHTIRIYLQVQGEDILLLYLKGLNHPASIGTNGIHLSTFIIYPHVWPSYLCRSTSFPIYTITICLVPLKLIANASKSNTLICVYCIPGFLWPSIPPCSILQTFLSVFPPDIFYWNKCFNINHNASRQNSIIFPLCMWKIKTFCFIFIIHTDYIYICINIY